MIHVGERANKMIRESLGCIDVNLTAKCNCDCKYCESHGNGKTLPMDVVEKIFDKLLDLQTRMMVLSGGEPLLYEQLGEVFDCAEEYGRFVVLLTNGLLVDDKIATKIKESVNIVRMTLDHIEEAKFDQVKGEGAYRKLMDTVALLHKVQMPVNFNMPVNPEEEFDVQSIIDFCRKNKVLSIRFSPILPIASGKKEYIRLLRAILDAIVKNVDVINFQDFKKMVSFDEFANAVRMLNCPGGTISLNVNADGGVTKCAFVKEELGNLYEKDLDEIWFTNFDSCEKKKCGIISREELEEILQLIGSYWDCFEIRKAISSWYMEIYGKKKMCLRGLPFWTLYFIQDK